MAKRAAKPRPNLMNMPTVAVGRPEEPARYVFGLKPAPKDRPRVFTRGKRSFAKSTDRTKYYEGVIRSESALQHPKSAPWEGDLTIYLTFFLKSRVHGDIDNLAKSLLDGAQGVVFKNDKQIRQLNLGIRIRKNVVERTEMIVTRFNDDDDADDCVPGDPDGDLGISGVDVDDVEF